MSLGRTSGLQLPTAACPVWVAGAAPFWLRFIPAAPSAGQRACVRGSEAIIDRTQVLPPAAGTMSSIANRTKAPSLSPPPPVRWEHWPAQAHPLVAAALSAGVVATGWLAAEVTARPYPGWLAAAALLVAFWRFFLPVRYELNSDGIHRVVLGRRRRIPWQSIRSFRADAGGVLLLPFPDPCPLDALRGEYLPWNDHRAEILAFLHYYVASDQEAIDSRLQGPGPPQTGRGQTDPPPGA